MSRTNTILLTSLLGSAWVGSALAQPLDARAVRPAVMLLVDTSGSMERLPDDGSASACDDCLPTCTGNTAQDSLQKNRWAVTVEALTGSMSNYTCQAVDRSTYPTTDYDYGYYLPHIDFRTNLSQNTDGILDSFVSRVKFGLMTFDGVGTTIGGETLVPLSTWSDPSFLAQANGAAGMYSYGRVGRLSFPGCPTDYGINAGARGPGNHPGALISVGLSDNPDDVRAVNQRIQSSLLEVRPFGGTPIAAMLDDLEHYVQTDPDISATSDPLYQCRSRVGILITDGAPDALFHDSRFQCDTVTDPLAPPGTACAPDTGGTSTTPACDCPYQTAEEVAQRLISSTNQLLDKLIVVAYNVHEPAALTTLNTIAQNGWPASQPPVGTSTDYPYLITADGPNQLRERLDELLDGQQPGVTSRSVPVSVDTGNGELSSTSKRFEITAGFEMGRNTDEPWRGLLFRRRVLCQGTTVNDEVPFDAAEGDIFHVSLNSQSASSRQLFTAAPPLLGASNGTLRNGSYSPEPVFPEDCTNFDSAPPPLGYDTRNLRHPYSGNFSLTDIPALDDSVSATQALASDTFSNLPFDNTLPAYLFGDADNDGLPGQAADRQRIVDYVSGSSRTQKMADIFHSNPVVLPPLTSSNVRANELASLYTSWQRQLIAPGADAHYGTDGRPGVVFVGTNDGILHAFNLDTWRDGSGSPRDGGHELWGFVPAALYGKMASMVAPSHQLMFDGTPQVKDVVLQKRPDYNPLFRTILVAALRGAPAFVALDVTFPDSPTFMWQATFQDVGDTVGNPAITQVTVNWRGERQQRAVAILPGGSGEQTSSCPTAGHALVDDVTRARFPTGNSRNVRCWKRRGRSLYVVDVATGQLLQEFGGEHFPSPVTGSVVVDSQGIGTSSAAYFFDHDGVLWRLSMLSAEPGDWRVTPIYDMFSSPVIRNVSSPLVELADWQAGRLPQYAPTLARDREGNLVILAGSGDVDNPMDTAMQRVVSLTELRRDATGEIGGEVLLNWQLDLDANEVVTGPIALFENNVYFGSFVSLSDGGECALGESRIYGAHAFEVLDENVTPGTPKPALVPEGGTLASPRELRQVVDPDGSNLLLGLTVARLPICRSPTTVFNAITQQTLSTGASGGGQFVLKASMAGRSTGGVNRGGSPIKELPRTVLPFTHPSSVSAWFGAVE